MLGAYLVGSIPTGWLIARLKGIKDIRQHGSGNIGATNVARFLGKPYFFLVFFLDAFKAFAYIWLIGFFVGQCHCLLLYACALLVGNSRSMFLDFKGGKGVATSVGLLLAIDPLFVVLILPTWLIVLATTRTVGMASVGAFIAAPIIANIFDFQSSMFWFVLAISIWVVFLHQDNILNYMKNRSKRQKK